jgi:cell wall-associated NlpC family hydrolase
MLGIGLVGVPSAPTAVAAPAPGIDELRRRVDGLRAEAEVATERYDVAREDIAGLKVRVGAARVKIGEGRATLDRARQQLARVAADTYKSSDLATVTLLLSNDPDSLLASGQLLASLGEQRANALNDLVTQRRDLVASLTDLEAQQQRLTHRESELLSAEQDVQRKLAAANRLLDRLTPGQRAQLSTAEDVGYRHSLADDGVNVPASGRLTCRDIALNPGDARVAKVIDYACSKIGDPYQWGASGPQRFDCSGLTMMAWKQVGVSLPHSAAMQATYGTTVKVEDLRPGDLVFFFSPIGHNGIYLGHGLMIHAPRTGESVRIAPIRYIGGFATAVRL